MFLRKSFALFSVTVVALGLAACGGPPAEEQGRPLAEESGLPPEVEPTLSGPEVIPTEESGLPPEAEIALPAEPVLSRLEATPSVVGAGESVTLRGDDALSGLLTVTTPTGDRFEVPFRAGQAEISLPSDAATGLYLAALDGQHGELALGTFRVADAPGIWLQADRQYVGEDESVILRIQGYRVPESLVFIGAGDMDWAAELSLEEEYLPLDEGDDLFMDEEEAGLEGTGGLTGTLLEPDETGLLLPALEPSRTADEVLDRPLELPGALAGPLQAVAIPKEGDVLVSNRLELQICDTPGSVQGDLSGPGQVRVVSFGGTLFSEAVETRDGAFSLEVPAGPAVLSGLPGIGPDNLAAPVQVAVEVPCGGTVRAELVNGAFEITIEAGATPVQEEFPGEEPDVDGGVLRLSGDLEGESPVFPLCSLDAEGEDLVLDVLLGTEMEDVAQISLTLPGVAVPGEAEVTAAFELTMVDFAESQGQAAATVVVTEDEFLPVAYITVAGAYQGEAGSGRMEAEIGCTILGGNSNRPGVGGLRARTVPPRETGAPAPLRDGQQPCRRVFVLEFTHTNTGDSQDTFLAAQLEQRLRRAQIIAISDIRVLLGLEAQKQLLGVGDESAVQAILGAMGADTVVLGKFGTFESQAFARITSFPSIEGDAMAQSGGIGDSLETVLFDRAVPAFLDQMADSALCPTVDPESGDVQPGEEIDLALEITNLAGEPVEGADVRVTGATLGQMDPENGNASGGRFETTYKADDNAWGTETLLYEASWRGKAGGVSLAEGTAEVRLQVGGNYRLTGNLAFLVEEDVPILGGNPIAIELEAYACQTGRAGPYLGTLRINPGIFLEFLYFTMVLGDVTGVFEPSLGFVIPAEAVYNPETLIILMFGGPQAVDDDNSITEAILDYYRTEYEAGEPILQYVRLEMPEDGGAFTFVSPQGYTGRYLKERGVVMVFIEGQPLFAARIEDLGREAACPPG